MKADFSGFPINTGKNFKHAMGIMLGTFSFAILVFALLYMFYIGPLEKYNFTQRLVVNIIFSTKIWFRNYCFIS